MPPEPKLPRWNNHRGMDSILFYDPLREKGTNKNQGNQFTTVAPGDSTVNTTGTAFGSTANITGNDTGYAANNDPSIANNTANNNGDKASNGRAVIDYNARYREVVPGINAIGQAELDGIENGDYNPYIAYCTANNSNTTISSGAVSNRASASPFSVFNANSEGTDFCTSTGDKIPNLNHTRINSTSSFSSLILDPQLSTENTEHHLHNQEPLSFTSDMAPNTKRYWGHKGSKAPRPTPRDETPVQRPETLTQLGIRQLEEYQMEMDGKSVQDVIICASQPVNTSPSATHSGPGHDNALIPNATLGSAISGTPSQRFEALADPADGHMRERLEQQAQPSHQPHQDGNSSGSNPGGASQAAPQSSPNDNPPPASLAGAPQPVPASAQMNPAPPHPTLADHTGGDAGDYLLSFELEAPNPQSTFEKPNEDRNELLQSSSAARLTASQPHTAGAAHSHPIEPPPAGLPSHPSQSSQQPGFSDDDPLGLGISKYDDDPIWYEDEMNPADDNEYQEFVEASRTTAERNGAVIRAPSGPGLPPPLSYEFLDLLFPGSPIYDQFAPVGAPVWIFFQDIIDRVIDIARTLPEITPSSIVLTHQLVVADYLFVQGWSSGPFLINKALVYKREPETDLELIMAPAMAEDGSLRFEHRGEKGDEPIDGTFHDVVPYCFDVSRLVEEQLGWHYRLGADYVKEVTLNSDLEVDLGAEGDEPVFLSLPRGLNWGSPSHLGDEGRSETEKEYRCRWVDVKKEEGEEEA
ncbi:hypothetical protein F5Y16DRAFT_397127 [Xylariaceae sp. FL0255]|nr:hypothetical protein F5Y16DRAFT_397127 [Xylariaceae sp. FL0255]